MFVIKQFIFKINRVKVTGNKILDADCSKSRFVMFPWDNLRWPFAPSAITWNFFEHNYLFFLKRRKKLYTNLKMIYASEIQAPVISSFGLLILKWKFLFFYLNFRAISGQGLFHQRMYLHLVSQTFSRCSIWPLNFDEESWGKNHVNEDLTRKHFLSEKFLFTGKNTKTIRKFFFVFFFSI